MRFLVIEDNNTDFVLIKGILEKVTALHAEITRAQRLSAGLKLLEKQHFDILLLDLGLPDSWGADTFLRAQSKFDDLPIIVLTSLDDTDVATRAVHLGAQDYLVKSQVNASALLRSVRYAIERKQRRTLLKIERDLALKLGSTSNLAEAFNSILDAVTMVDGVSCGSIHLVNRMNQALKLVACRGVTDAARREIEFLDPDSNAAKMAKAGQVFYGQPDSMERDELWTLVVGEGILSLAVLPINSQGRVVAMMTLGSRAFAELPVSTRETVESISLRLGDTLARIEAEENLRQLNDTLEKRVEARIKDLINEITERKRIEAAMRESEEKYRLLVEQANDGIVITQDHLVKFANKRFELMTGYCREEIVNQPLTRFFLDDDGRKIDEWDVRRLAGEDLPPVYESRIFNKQGEEIIVEFNHKMSFFEGGKAVQSFIRDITERKRAEEEAKLRKEQLVQADKMVSLGILVAGVAHEINNPNNCITLNTPIIKNFWEKVQPILDAKIEDKSGLYVGGIPYSELEKEMPMLFEGIMDSAERIKNIVNGLKDYARKDQAHLENLVDVNKVVQAALTLLANMTKNATSQLRARLHEPLPNVRGSAQKIEQVLVNLIQNACQALPDKSRPLEIATDYDQLHDKVVVTVADGGQGIPLENLKHVTDPFYTTKRDTGGTGLGLSISAGIVKDHGGDLLIESAPGRGTTVTVALPAYHAQTQD